MRSIVQDDPWWFADPHRKAYVEQILLGPTLGPTRTGPAAFRRNRCFRRPDRGGRWRTPDRESQVRSGLRAGGRWIRTSSSARDRLHFDVRGGVSGASGRPRRAARLVTRLCYPRGRVVAI